jgi:F-type H+-transporting ATPase subunit delta
VRIPKKSKREAKRLFRGCLVAGVLDEGRVRGAVGLVIGKRPRGFLPMLTHFQRLVRLETERRRATVESVLPLPAALQSAVQGDLTRLYGPGLSFDFRQEPQLVGGLRVQVGSDVFDGSIRARLDAFQESLS